MSANALHTLVPQQAWVVFSGQTDMAWLKWLRPGFRHCFVLLNDGRQWFSLDPLSNHMEVQVYNHLSGEFDLPGWLKKRGHKVVKAPVMRSHRKPAPVMIFTCVEAVKRVLGLHKARILTPWQLYKFLTASDCHPRQVSAKRERRAGIRELCAQLGCAPFSGSPLFEPAAQAAGMTTENTIQKGNHSWEA